MDFITDKPVLLVEDTLVIGDLHIGIEYSFWKSGIRVPSQTENMKKELTGIIKKVKPEKLVFLGDIKHKVPGTTFQEAKEIPEFFDFDIDMHVVPGNHDDNLKKILPKKVKLHPSKGFLSGKNYFLHGHTWPSSGFLKADYVFVGHEHPQIRFIDDIGYRYVQDVWIIADLKKKELKKKYDSGKFPKLVIVPKFNSLSGGISMNMSLDSIEKEHKRSHTGLGPLVRVSDMKNADAYLLDGTFLGKLGNIK